LQEIASQMVELMMVKSRHFNESLLKETIKLVKERYEMFKGNSKTQ